MTVGRSVGRSVGCQPAGNRHTTPVSLCWSALPCRGGGVNSDFGFFHLPRWWCASVDAKRARGGGGSDDRSQNHCETLFAALPDRKPPAPLLTLHAHSCYEKPSNSSPAVPLFFFSYHRHWLVCCAGEPDSGEPHTDPSHPRLPPTLQTLFALCRRHQVRGRAVPTTFPSTTSTQSPPVSARALSRVRVCYSAAE